MLWTTEVLINKIINEEHPKGVYFAPYWGKWLLMITTGFCNMSPLRANVTKNQTFSKFRGNSSKINLAHNLMLDRP